MPSSYFRSISAASLQAVCIRVSLFFELVFWEQQLLSFYQVGGNEKSV